MPKSSFSFPSVSGQSPEPSLFVIQLLSLAIPKLLDNHLNIAYVEEVFGSVPKAKSNWAYLLLPV